MKPAYYLILAVLAIYIIYLIFVTHVLAIFLFGARPSMVIPFCLFIAVSLENSTENLFHKYNIQPEDLL